MQSPSERSAVNPRVAKRSAPHVATENSEVVQERPKKWTRLPFEKSYVVAPNGCWEWVRGKFSHFGYGSFCKNGRAHYAHRVSYEMHRGEIPEGLEVCHRCDNPGCVNPEHLFLATHAENMRDARSKGRVARGDKIPRAVLNEEKVRLIRSMSHLSDEILGKMFGISAGGVWYVRTRKTWKHIA